MAYTPPSGWIERRVVIEQDEPQRTTFHRSDRCPRIEDTATLTQTDKPYSAVRCIHCGR